jgi:hypothetical protein
LSEDDNRKDIDHSMKALNDNMMDEENNLMDNFYYVKDK